MVTMTMKSTATSTPTQTESVPDDAAAASWSCVVSLRQLSAPILYSACLKIGRRLPLLYTFCPFPLPSLRAASLLRPLLLALPHLFLSPC